MGVINEKKCKRGGSRRRRGGGYGSVLSVPVTTHLPIKKGGSRR